MATHVAKYGLAASHSLAKIEVAIISLPPREEGMLDEKRHYIFARPGQTPLSQAKVLSSCSGPEVSNPGDEATAPVCSESQPSAQLQTARPCIDNAAARACSVAAQWLQAESPNPA